MKSKTIVLLGEDEVSSIEETFPQVIESTSDRFTYRIKGMEDIDYVEVGIANADGTQLLLVDEDAIDGVLSRIAIGGKFYSDIENQDEWVNQYSSLADLIYEDVMPEGYCSHACEIGCAHGWTIGLIRWLDAKLGTELIDEDKDNISITCDECGEDVNYEPNELNGRFLCNVCFGGLAFNDDGQYKEYKNTENSEKGDIKERTGGATNYYNIKPKEDGYVDVDRICDQLKLSFAEGNTLKALFGIAIERLTGEARHTAAGHHIDAEKFKHYSKQVYMKVNESDGN